ncbi:MAG: hypothetical protein IPI17_17910 [Nitrosomonas sp.]|nr:hypothetical protein [Nitrosomonas sp.]MBK7493592.1 hypothetical protein [Nitrosomonas sp.]MBP9872099.1 hypothetical protein [Nitrosomonas sp.]
MRTDLFNSINLKRGISPYDHATGDAAVVSQIIDMQGIDALVFAIATGSLADADATFTVLIEESDDSGMSGASAVADADLLGTEALASFTFGSDDKCFKIGYKGSKRYVTCTITPANNTGAALLCVIAITVPQILPSANPPA